MSTAETSTAATDAAAIQGGEGAVRTALDTTALDRCLRRNVADYTGPLSVEQFDGGLGDPEQHLRPGVDCQLVPFAFQRGSEPMRAYLGLRLLLWNRPFVRVAGAPYERVGVLQATNAQAAW